MNPTKTRVITGAPEGKATSAPLVAPVVLLGRQSRCIFKSYFSHNGYWRKHQTIDKIIQRKFTHIKQSFSILEL